MNQPVAMDLESVGVVELLTGSGEVAEEGHTVTIHEVRAHAVMSIYITHTVFFQVPDIQARNSQAAGGNSIRRFLSMSLVSQPFPGHIVKPSALSIRSSVELPMFVLIDDVKLN